MERQDFFDMDGSDFRLKNSEIFHTMEKPQIYEKNQMIYQQGDYANNIYYLLSGRIQVFISSPDGDERILFVLTKGSLFGKAAFFDKTPRTSSAKALQKSEIITISKEMMTEIIRKQPEFALDLLEYLSKTIRMLSIHVDNISFLQADKRIALLLADIARNNRANSYIACTHEEIADMVGVSRVTVSKILSEFTHKGWITTGYKQIKIINIGALNNYGLKR